MISFGVFAGANRPMKFCATMLGKPASTAVGSDGKAASRLGLVTHSMRTLPVSCSSIMLAVTLCAIIGMCPLMRSEISGPPPR